ncbi:uncharacterized protein Dana_GF18494, isoform A [Drosophila ananassae]|uniref:Uncharacterized protein, isoform A n=1 Tax=Drosophila ananassae TaxID=7217 RepID=B3M2J4_DROAN|nr:uncharacterized protein LOC6501267 isoform X1 [Drosophila ananassae]EDV43447.1 uncharacterized protein Dana_GF18494, isoform A [Drosophila ananassae]
MYRYLLVYFATTLIQRQSTLATLCITKVIVRVPREKDIGLIFDLTVINRIKGMKRETVDFVIASDGECTVNTTRGELVSSVGRVYGADFGTLEPGKSETVSLVWPTVSLYNRVGSCPITIITTNAQNAVSTSRQIIHFDTRFEVLDPKKQTLCKRKDFVNCHNWDKDYLRNCTPLNCEERYFGQRSFFNQDTGQCEVVPPCYGDGKYYDPFANEGVDFGGFLSEDEVEQIKQGDFDINFLELRGPPKEPQEKSKTFVEKEKPPTATPKALALSPEDCDKSIQNTKYLTLADFIECFQHIKESSGDKKIQKKSPFEVPLLTQLYYDWFLPIRADTLSDFRGRIAADGPSSKHVRSGAEPLMNWLAKLDYKDCLKLFFRGLAIISLLILFQIGMTLLAYFLVCLAVYGFIEIYSTWKSEDSIGTYVADVASHSSSLDVVTTESLMSKR